MELPVVFLYVFPYNSTKEEELKVLKKFKKSWNQTYYHARLYYPYGPLNEEDQRLVHHVCYKNWGFAIALFKKILHT